MKTHLDALNPPQRLAAETVEGPLMVLAGAGSGKTRMLISRIVQLMTVHQVSPHEILAVTFTNKAAGEMKDRVERTLQEISSSEFRGFWVASPEIGTFHSVCIRILRRELERTPFTKAFVVYDDSDQLSLIKSVMKKLDIDPKAFNPKSFQAAINRAKCDAHEPHDLDPDAFSPFDRNLRRVYEQYQKDLFTNNALDFGEILCMTYRLFRDHEDVRKRYQERYRYIHVDEYQDTNRVQYLLLSTLASPEFGGHQNICVVGDEDQSIYSWRGADIRNILDFEKDYPGAQVVKLEQNYRSTQNIIRAASQVISNNFQRKDKRLWTENDNGDKIVRVVAPDDRLEAEFVVREIRRQAAEEGRSFDEFAVFYRTHAQSRQLEEFFRRDKVMYQIVGGLRFYDRKEIKDILAYLKVIHNPADSISLKRIINTPVRGIGKTTIDKLEALASGTLWETLEAVADGHSDILSGSAARKLSAFTEMMRRLMAEQPKVLLSELYHLLLDETGMVRLFKDEGTVESLARIDNLEELDNMLAEFEEDLLGKLTDEQREQARGGLLTEFIERTALVSDVDQGFDPTSVKMMTLHSSKGLEFPVVFLVGMEEGLFPSTRPWEESEDGEIEEERRLCYVGMTRARERLYLSSAAVRRIWGQTHYQEPSRFFAEIPDELMDVRDFTAGRSRVVPSGGMRGYERGEW